MAPGNMNGGEIVLVVFGVFTVYSLTWNWRRRRRKRQVDEALRDIYARKRRNGHQS